MINQAKMTCNECALTTEQIRERIAKRQSNAKCTVLEHDQSGAVNWAAYAHLMYLRDQNNDIDSDGKIIWNKWTRSCAQRDQDLKQLKADLNEFIQNSSSLTDGDQMAAKAEVLAASENNKVDWVEFLEMINNNNADHLREITENMIQ